MFVGWGVGAEHRILIHEASPAHWDILCIPRDKPMKSEVPFIT